MIMETPKKSASNETIPKEKTLTPITLPKSPAQVSPQKNLTGLPRVAKDIVADIYNTIQKWNDHHLRGCNIIKQITLLKLDCLDQYPLGLEEMMLDLFETVEKLSGISSALTFLTQQMQALVKLQKTSSPLFVSLTIRQLAELCAVVSESYIDEFKEKQHCLENIAHAKTKHDVMFFATTWTYQKNITKNINLKLETLLTETGHRKTT